MSLIQPTRRDALTERLGDRPNPANPAERLRIALFTYSTKSRGGVIHTLELAAALHHLGHEVCLYALSKDGQGFERPLVCSTVLIPAQSAPTDTDALIRQRIQEFVDYLNQHPPHYDIYHAQDCLSANALAALRQTGAIPHLIRTVHHIDEHQSPYLQACQERSLRGADWCFCVSQHWQAQLQQQFQIQAARVFNGVNLQRFSSAWAGTEVALKDRLGLYDRPVYLTVGGIEPRKNSLNLLQAFALVLKALPTAQLVIAGGATMFDYKDYQAEFFALAEALEIELGRSLILPGMLSAAELPALYRLADAFVFPSLKEGWGLVLLEAIASGLPVITSDQPPFTEFLTTQQALLVDPQVPVAIAAAMTKILQPAKRTALLQQSQPILSTYTWENSANRHVQLYRQLLRQSQTLEARNATSLTP